MLVLLRFLTISHTELIQLVRDPPHPVAYQSLLQASLRHFLSTLQLRPLVISSNLEYIVRVLTGSPRDVGSGLASFLWTRSG
jgi:hypothetical protein